MCIRDSVGATDRGFVPEDRLYVTRRHHVGRVLHVHAARVRRDGGLLRASQAGRLPAAGQVHSDAAPRSRTAHRGLTGRRLVHLLQSGRTHHLLVAKHAASSLQVHRGQ